MTTFLCPTGVVLIASVRRNGALMLDTKHMELDAFTKYKHVVAKCMKGREQHLVAMGGFTSHQL